MSTTAQMACNTDSKPWKRFWLGLALCALIVGVYLPVLRCGFIWDDDDYVTNNPTLTEPGGLKQIWFKLDAAAQYYPLVYTSFWLERHAWGLNPAGYHAVNVLLHALGALLLWRLLDRLKIPGAWFAALIFGLHPVHVESVVWITERKNVLSGVFYLAAALCYLRFDRTIASGAGSRRWGWYGGALAFFIAALFSKTVTCSLPAALLLVIWWKRGKLGWNDVWPTLPLFAIGAGLGLTTAWLEKHYIGAQGEGFDFTFWGRCLIAGRAVWFYAMKLVWPTQLTFIYPRWQIDAAAGWQWLFPICAAAVVVCLWLLRHKLGRGPLVAVLFFGGTLFPALGFINVYPMKFSFVADHFQYLASVGLIVLLTATLFLSAGRWRQGTVQWLPLLIIAAGLGWLTARQIAVYRSVETLWQDTLAKNPDSYLAHHNLASHYQSLGRVEEAIDHYSKASQIDPNCITLINLAHLQNRSGHPDDALETYTRAFQQPTIPSDRRYLVVALNDFSELLLRKGRYADAANYLQLSAQLDPNNARTFRNLGATFSSLSRSEEAIACFQSALRLDPNDAGTHQGLGMALAVTGKMEEAIPHFQAVILLRPNNADAHQNLGSVLASVGRIDEAIEQFQSALRIDPNHAEAKKNLDQALSTKGQPD